MCGRYVLRRFRAADYDAAPKFEEFTDLKVTPRFNIAPSQDIVAIRLDKNDKRVATLIKWGLIPSWTKGKPKAQPINARCETAATSGMFKAAFARRRCLIPADGFFEWRTGEHGKQPFFIHRPDDKPFAFAGLWERWKNEAGEIVDTCTILTTSPNALMSTIHDRMPVILDEADYAKWLDRNTAPEELQKLMKPDPDGQLEAYPVSPAVNKPVNDSPDNLKKIDAA